MTNPAVASDGPRIAEYETIIRKLGALIPVHGGVNLATFEHDPLDAIIDAAIRYIEAHRAPPAITEDIVERVAFAIRTAPVFDAYDSNENSFVLARAALSAAWGLK